MYDWITDTDEQDNHNRITVPWMHKFQSSLFYRKKVLLLTTSPRFALKSKLARFRFKIIEMR